MANTTGNFTFTNDTDSTGGGGGPPPDSYYKIQSENMWKIIPPIIIVWGTIGNCLTIVVMQRQFRNLSSTATYLFMVAIVDTMTLWLGPLRQWILQLWERDVRKLTTAGCRVQTLLTYATVQISAWLLVAVTMERLLSVVSPHTVKMSCTPRKAAIICTAIVVAVMTLNVHYLWDLDLDVYIPAAGRSYDCIGTTENYRLFLEDIWPWIDFVVAFLAPFLCLLVGNVGIILKLESKRRWRRRTSQGSKLTSTEKESRKITIMLITLSVMFFVCMSPVSIFYIYLPELAEDVLAIQDPFERWDSIQYYLIFMPAVVNNIAYINASFNFVLYVLSGSKFRNELILLVTCRKLRANDVFGSGTTGSKYKTATSRLATSASTNGIANVGNDIEPSDDDKIETCVEKSVTDHVTYELENNGNVNAADSRNTSNETP